MLQKCKMLQKCYDCNNFVTTANWPSGASPGLSREQSRTALRARVGAGAGKAGAGAGAGRLN